MEVQHRDSGAKGAFFVEQNDRQLAEMTYVWAGTKRIIIDHTEVSDELRGQEHGHLQKEVDRISKECDRLETKLGNPNFTAKAPADVILKEKEKLAAQKNELEQLKTKLTALA